MHESAALYRPMWRQIRPRDRERIAALWEVPAESIFVARRHRSRRWRTEWSRLRWKQRGRILARSDRETPASRMERQSTSFRSGFELPRRVRTLS